MEKIPSYIVLLLICILSRLLSSVYYIEDPESLKVAEALYENLISVDFKSVIVEHSLFIAIGKVFYFVFRNIAIVFSLLGGISIFFIFTYTLYLINVPILSLEGILVGSLIFFNPLFWIASNKYSADLAGVAILLAAFFYLVPETYKKFDNLKGWFLAGLLMGVKLSYFPFLIIPCLYSLVFKKKVFLSLGVFIIGIAIALLPALIYLGGNDFLEISLNNFRDYFTNQNLLIDSNYYLERFIALLKDLWADGIGGYWIDRNPALILISIGSASCLVFGFFILLNFDLNRTKISVLVLSIILYGIWVFVLGDPIEDNYDVLPVLSFALVLIGYGVIYFLVNFNFIFIKVLAFVFILGNIFLTIVLVVQHTYPTAIAQAKEYVLNKKGIGGEDVTIIAPPEINHFFSEQNVRVNYVLAGRDSLAKIVSENKKEGRTVLIIEDKKLISGVKNVVHFSHNPYVNRNWPNIYIYEY